jgi:hypothetical protein
MKLTNSTKKTLYTLLALGAIIGTTAWELLIRVVRRGDLSLSVGPVGFDAEVLELWIMVNPGTVLGLALGYALFRLS